MAIKPGARKGRLVAQSSPPAAGQSCPVGVKDHQAPASDPQSSNMQKASVRKRRNRPEGGISRQKNQKPTHGLSKLHTPSIR